MYDVTVNNDVKLYQGADFRQRFTVLENGVAVNITGATFTCKFRWAYTDAAAVFSLATGTGISIITAGSGIYEIVIDDTVTAAVVFPTSTIEDAIGNGSAIQFDCNITLGGNVYQVLRGTARMFRSANR